ncbi:hypothetical protein GCM10010844_39710 [Deinococcus radiotolerans]|uniref:Uncharacterized protein n=1 Tax=Deinococcus radiotolerans TaxID=1309407 RepID=A0ABQ2FQJ1_9DEIO|nr:hypothetical protein GCM10010844_39710 [Deinococcus radiotolerans]
MGGSNGKRHPSPAKRGGVTQAYSAGSNPCTQINGQSRSAPITRAGTSVPPGNTAVNSSPVNSSRLSREISAFLMTDSCSGTLKTGVLRLCKFAFYAGLWA